MCLKLRHPPRAPDPDPAPARRLFVFDGLHLSAAGYALWTSVVKPRLVADFGEAGR